MLQKLKSAALASVLCVAGLVASATAEAQTVIDRLNAERETGIFATLVERAGLADTLRGAGPFTVFAPIDSAFDLLPPRRMEALMRPENAGQLRTFVQAHIVQQQFPLLALGGSESAPSAQLQTLGGGGIILQANNSANPTIGTGRAITTNIRATNGVIHTIDRVNLP